MTDQESVPNGVRVTNVEIYRLLLDTNARVAAVDQTVRDVVRPTLESQQQAVARLADRKADAESLNEMKRRVEKVEWRMYAIVSGLVAAIIGGKGLGFL